MKIKKFVGYVPKGETIMQTIEEFQLFSNNPINQTYFGMYSLPDEIFYGGCKAVKRTITLSWEDEPVKEIK